MAPRHNHHVDLRRHQVEDPCGRRGAPRPRLGLVVGARRRRAHQQVQAAAKVDSARGRPHAMHTQPRHELEAAPTQVMCRPGPSRPGTVRAPGRQWSGAPWWPNCHACLFRSSVPPRRARHTANSPRRYLWRAQQAPQAGVPEGRGEGENQQTGTEASRETAPPTPPSCPLQMGPPWAPHAQHATPHWCPLGPLVLTNPALPHSQNDRPTHRYQHFRAPKGSEGGFVRDACHCRYGPQGGLAPWEPEKEEKVLSAKPETGREYG